VAGFSLIELMVAVGIVVFLAALLIPFSKNLLRNGESVREMAGARRAVAAWINYAGENNGELLTGYAQSGSVTDRRYVYRLAPYLNNDLRGSLLVNKQATLKDAYSISMQPSFGMNITFVGGDYGALSQLNPDSENGGYVVKRMPQIHSPSKLLVFASARITDPSFTPKLAGADFGQREGYNAVLPRQVSSQVWVEESYDEKRPYYDFGYLHLRYQKRAVCAMADGHVEMLGFEELKDMRRWANQAAIEDNPNWMVP
jgi:prepilin-type processing-associated H-X9-DG protein